MVREPPLQRNDCGEKRAAECRPYETCVMLAAISAPSDLTPPPESAKIIDSAG